MVRPLGRAAVCALLCAPLAAQVQSFPFSESFDFPPQPPPAWTLSGFSLNASAPRSSPNCVSATGNFQLRRIATPILDPGSSTLDRLTFAERRSSSALRYRLMITAVSEDSSALVRLAMIDTISAVNSYTVRSVRLDSEEIASLGPFRIVWDILPDSINSTGVLRLDDIAVTALVETDGALGAPSVQPGAPASNESVTVVVSVRNAGHRTMIGATVQFALSRSLTGGDVRSGSLSVSELAPGDSTALTAQLGLLSPAAYRFSARIVVTGDARSENDTTGMDIRVVPSQGQIVVNEIMYAPGREDEPEWVELHNPGSQAVDLAGCTLSDRGTSRVAIGGPTTIVDPFGYLVIASGTDLPGVYDLTAVHVLTVGLPSLNNTTPDAVVLRGPDGRTVDSAAYDPSWGIEGISLERRDAVLPSSSRRTWRTSTDLRGATPGSVNSVARKTVDAAISSFDTGLITERSFASATIVIRNEGRDPHLPKVGIFRDDREGFPRLPLIEYTTATTLPPEDSVTVELSVPVDPGRNSLVAVVNAPGDENRQNDSCRSAFIFPFSKGALVVNEIMYEPGPGTPQWVEVFNPGASPVDLRNWSIADNPTLSGSQTRSILPDRPLVVRPGRFGVIASDSTVSIVYPWLSDPAESVLVVSVNRAGGLGMNRDGDAVILTDLLRTTVDSVRYDPDWHASALPATQNRTLERISPAASSNLPENWSSSVAAEGATPGRPNSVRAPERSSAHALIEVLPHPFSPNGDGFEDQCFLRVSGLAGGAFVTARIYDARGRIVRRWADRAPVGPDLPLRWDGRDDNGRPLPLGLYIVVATAEAGQGGRTEHLRQVVGLVR